MQHPPVLFHPGNRHGMSSFIIKPMGFLSNPHDVGKRPATGDHNDRPQIRLQARPGKHLTPV